MPAGVFRCTDGELMLVVGNDGQFSAHLRGCWGSPELATDPRFLKNNDRVVHGKEIMAIFAGLFLKKPVAYWLDELEKAGVPSVRSTISSRCSPIRTSSRAACGSRSIIPLSRIFR